ncbi:MAG: host-nuclease inhibitor Gam family protein [Pseudomonadota bacterium]
MADRKPRDFSDINEFAQTYAEENERLAAILVAIDKDIRVIHERYAAALADQAMLVSCCRGELIDLVDAARHLFVKPKSQTVAGVRVGLRKGQDRLKYDDEGKLIHRISTLLPAQADSLLRQKIEINKDALKILSTEDRQRLGVKLVMGADEPFAQISKSDAEKVAASILEHVSEQPTPSTGVKND